MKSDGVAFLRTAAYVFSAPSRWDEGNWLIVGGIGAGTVGASLLDEEGRSLMQRNVSRFNRGISDYAVVYGDGLSILFLSAGGYAVGLVFREDWLRETAMLAGTAFLIAATISTVTKVAVGRARPYMGEGHLSFKPFTFSGDDYFSFPSGHTIGAFAVSGVLAARIKNVWASIGLYSLATATAYSRMYTDQHWFSDVVVGAAISIAVSQSVVHFHEGTSEASCQTGFRLVPRMDGLELIWTF